jgi:glycosyltransferase involved in cell wall biosynthesis
MNERQPLRIAVIAGTLGAGGAEKQLYYHVRCLTEAGVRVLLVSLDGPGHYGPMLAPLVEQFVCIDESGGRLTRMARIASVTRRFSADFVQATHTYANLYAWAAARAAGAVSIGALRVDLRTSAESNGWFSRWHFTLPDVMISNCHCGADGLARVSGRDPQTVYVLDNALDISRIDRDMKPRAELRRWLGATDDDVVVLGVGTLRGDKAFDRFARVIERARQRLPRIKGAIIGDGPERPALETLRAASPSLQEGLTLLGRHGDAVTLMAGADIFFLSSDNEGVPNALLEAMAAGLPAVVTPAGDAERVVTQANAGIVKAFEDEASLADGLVELAGAVDTRRTMGRNARRGIEREFDYRLLWPRMRRIYLDIATRAGRRPLIERFDALRGES